MDRLLSKIHELGLDHVPTDWVDSVYLSDFNGYNDMPAEALTELESIEIKNVFGSILECMEELKDTDENSWASIKTVVPYQTLLAVLDRYIKYGTNNVTVRKHRATALLAARIYFRCLLMTGARCYSVYHSRLLAHSIACLGFPKLMCEKIDLYKTNKHLSNELNIVVKELSQYVIDLREVLLLLRLTPTDMNFEDILNNLIDVTGSSITQMLSNIDVYMLSNVSSVIYQVISCILNNYGDQPNAKCIELLFKCLVPKLVATTTDNKPPTGFVRASYVTYAGYILSMYSTAAVKSFVIMLEHICYSPECLGLAEHRNARADLVVGLMSLLPDRRHRKFVKWLILLSTTSRVVHRYIALEILSRLLNNEPELNDQRENIRNEIEKQSAFAQALPIETAAAAAAAINVTVPMVEDDISQDSQDSRENAMEEGEEMDNDEEVSGLMRREPHTVPLGRILHAVYERALDASSGVRQRALTVLTDSAGSERTYLRQALQVLNGDGTVSRLLALGARSVCDERAVVRKAAIGLVTRLLITSANPITADNLAILVKLCRDAAITVRTAAIAELGDLVFSQPGETVIDAFLTGPLYQLGDPETKIQDQVKCLIQKMLINPLVKNTSNGYNEDPLPWLFLQGIIKHNMRKNLQIACMLLAKSETCISVRLVDKLSAYLGVKDKQRDLQCLVLLTCVAQHVDYSDIAFVLEYYYDMAQLPGQEAIPYDSRLMTMVLELLNSWSKFAKAHDRVKLRDHLVARLAAGIDDGCRIPSVVLAKVLDPENLVWASELMQHSEQLALENNCIGEALRVADLSLVAPRKPSPKILQLFLSALTTPTPDMTEKRAGDCVAGAGRLCLRSLELATVAAPALADLLHSTAPLQARVNALLALADFSQRYGNVVEPLLGTICRCLEAQVPARLRRTAARSMTQLLLRGFLRLRKPLYYNYFALLTDADHEVREPAEYYVTSCLQPKIICQNFVDCVLHYNDSTETLDFDARQLIYDVMLQRLSLVERLNTQCRLAREILQHAADLVDSEDEIPAALHAAMLDTIKLLIGPRMRLPRKPQHTGDVADLDDIQERVTTNIVSHKMKRTVAEVMVPAVMRLYARLGSGGGQLAAYLVMLVQELEVDYKEEIEELIMSDDDLVVRIAAFRENHAVQSTTGNMRNLVTSSGPPEPETPKPQRKRSQRREPVKKRSLKI